jgi:hypothetical protein
MTTNNNNNLFEGSHVVLTIDKDPWYQSGNLGISQEHIPSDFTSDDDPYKTDVHVKYAPYKSNVRIDKTKSDLGFGHSFLERKNNTEKFTMSNNTNRNILILLLIIIVIIYLVKRHNK